MSFIKRNEFKDWINIFGTVQTRIKFYEIIKIKPWLIRVKLAFIVIHYHWYLLCFYYKHNVLTHLYFVFSWTALPSASALILYVTPTADISLRTKITPHPLCAEGAAYEDYRAHWIAACVIVCQFLFSTVQCTVLSSRQLWIKYCVVKDQPGSSIYCMLKSHGRWTREGGIVGLERSLHNDKVIEKSLIH